MEKNEEIEDKENESEEENEEFPILKRKRKFEMTPEDIKAKYTKYLNCKLKYPKSQFCFFYFKGTCLLGNKCQFCHGYKEFSMDRYFTFLADKDAVEYSSQKYYQKFYFNMIISTDEYTYDNLLEFQETHPELFKKKYTFQQLKKSRKKRLEIRNPLTKEIIEKFLVELFNRINFIKFEDLSYYIYNVGYPLSVKKLLKNTKVCFPKNVKENNKNSLYFVKNLSPEEMMNFFVKKTIEYMKNGKYEDYFPINYSKISKIIFTTIKGYEPNLTIYKHQTNILDKDFINIFTEKLIDECNEGNFDLIKNKKKEDILENITVIINNEIDDKQFKLNSSKFSCFNFEDIFKDKSSDLKFKLFNDGYLFYFNNDKWISFNYNKCKSFNIEDFYNNNYYYKDCFKEEEKLEKEIENLNINSSNDINEENIKLNSNNIYNIDNTIINFINDENSLKYFKNQSKTFEVLSIDIEGQFDTSLDDIKINLIQICDDTNLKNEIYVIDFNTFKYLDKKIFIELSKILKDLFDNPNIKKIFFDGKSDLLSLHKELNVCPKNFIDLSALYNATNSYAEQYQFKKLKGEKNEKTFNMCLNLCRKNYFFKGLNVVLQEYHTKHCVNPLKKKYHALFKEKDFDYWAQRPIIQEYILYSALDVKYEFDTYNNIKIKFKKVLMDFYDLKDISESNVDLVILLISSGNHNIACNNYIKKKKESKENK